MNKLGKVVPWALLSCAPTLLFAQAADRPAKVDEVFAKWNSRDTPGCAVAVAENGRTVLARAYGMADLEHDVANTPETIFEAGSVSKQFTAAAVARYPAQKLSVAVLCNAGEANTADLAHRTIDLFLTGDVEPVPSPKVVEVKPEVLARRAGLYRNLRTGEPLELKLTEGKLTLGGGRVVQPLSDSLFYVAEGVTVAVEEGTEGRPTVLRFKLDTGDVIPWEAVAPVSPTPEQLAEYVGEYRSDEAEVTYTVVLADGKLSLKRRPATSHELTPAYADAFRSSIGWLVRFFRDGEGKVRELSFGLGRVRDLRLARVDR